MSFHIQRVIPGLKIVPPKGEEKRPTEKQLGFDMFPALNPSIALYGPRRSGKTTVVYNILARIITKKDKVVIFCPSIDFDPGWNRIKDLLKQRGVDYVTYPDVAGRDEDGTPYNHLNELIKALQAKKEIGDIDFRTFVIIDDLTKNQIKKPSVDNITKIGRHFGITLIISTQAPLDISADARQQLEFIVLFARLPERLIRTLHDNWKLTIPSDTFVELYDEATSVPHRFLFVLRPQEEYRFNFDQVIEVEHRDDSHFDE